MADINLTTDFSQLVAMNQEVKSTDTLFVKVVDSLLREVKRANRVTKALAETTEQNLKIINAAEQIAASKVQEAATKREKARQREADRAEKEAQRIIAANEKTAAAQAKLTAEIERNKAASAQASTANLNQRLGVTGAPATSQGAGFGAMEAEIERLRMKYDQVYSASNLYERSLAELNRAHMLGITSANRHKAAVEQLNLEYQQFANATEGAVIANNRFSQHINESGRNLNKFGMYAQQVGYQVGDFFVQIQSGTNVLVAFGQQATQLAGLIPGVLGAALGIGISLATAIGSAFMRTGENAKSASDGLSKYQQALEGVKGSLESLQTEINKLQFGEEDPVIANARKALEEAQNKLLLAQSSQRRIGSAIVPTTEELANLREATISYYDLARTLNELVNKSEAHAEAQRMLNGHMSVSAAYVRGITEGLIKQRAETERVKQAHAGQVVYMGKTRQESDNFVASLKSAYILLGNSKVAAAGLADQMARAANAWITSNSAGGASYMANQYSSYGEGRAAAELLAKESGVLYGGVSVLPDTTVGGGAGGSEPSESMLEKFQKQLDLEKELLNTTEAYQRVRSALGEEFANTSPKIIEGLVQQAEGIEELTRLEEQRKSLMDSISGSLETGFMAMVKGTQTVGEAFKSMAAAIIEELFRVLVVQKLVGGITSAFGGGTFTNVAGLTGGGRASGGSMMSGSSYLVGENGPEIVIPRHSGTVLNANQTAGAMAGSGGITVQNNITVTGSDAAMVRQEVAKMIPQITNATKAAVIDAKQRGGQMAAAFR